MRLYEFVDLRPVVWLNAIWLGFLRLKVSAGFIFMKAVLGQIVNYPLHSRLDRSDLKPVEGSELVMGLLLLLVAIAFVIVCVRGVRLSREIASVEELAIKFRHRRAAGTTQTDRANQNVKANGSGGQ